METRRSEYSVIPVAVGSAVMIRQPLPIEAGSILSTIPRDAIDYLEGIYIS